MLPSRSCKGLGGLPYTQRDGLTFIVSIDVTDQWVLAALAGRETYGTQVLWCRRSCMRLLLLLLL